MILFRRGDYMAASEAFDRGGRIAARMGWDGASYNAGRCMVRTAAGIEAERARVFCDRAVRTSGASSWTLTARGYHWFMQGRMTEAAADFARAIERNEYAVGAIYGRGVIAVRDGRVGEGEGDIARARELDRLEVDLYANAGLRP